MSATRLTLREDAYYVASDSGLSILTHGGVISLSGSSVYQWLDRIAPYLDGRFSLAELTAGLPASRRELVESLLATLQEQGVVTEAADRPAASDEASSPPEARFIGYFSGSASDVYERYRGTAALIAGSGQLVEPVVRAAVRSGLRRVRVAITADSEGTATPDPRGAGWPGGEARISTYILTADPEAELDRLVRSAGLVVHVADQPEPVRSGLVELLCARAGLPLAQAIATPGEVWIRPATAGGPGWTDGWQRLIALTGPASAGPEHNNGTRWRALVANQVVHDLFRFATGLRPEPGRPAMTCVEVTTVRSHRHTFLPGLSSARARGEGEDEFTARMTALASAEPLSAETFSTRAAALSDSRLGVFSQVSEENFAQMPLHAATATVADPGGLLSPAAPRPVVTGIGTDFAAARHQAALRALGTYGSLAVDARRLLTGEGALLAGRPGLADVAARTRAGLLRPWVRGLRLVDSRPLLVPAALVFPALESPVAPYTAPEGTAAGYSWPEVLEAGLLAQCRRLTADAALKGAARFPVIDLQTATADPVITYCRGMLTAAGASVTACEITGPLGVPTCACAVDGETVACVSGLTMADALREALLQALAACQARANGEPAYAPRVPAGLAVAAGPGPAVRMRTDTPFDATRLATALARQQKVAVAVPLDHDQGVHDVMPFLACVVVTDAGQ